MMSARFAEPLIPYKGPYPCDHCDGTSNGIEFMPGIWSCCLGALLASLSAAPLPHEHQADTAARLAKRRRQFTVLWNRAVARTGENQ